MLLLRPLTVIVLTLGVALAQPSAVEVVQDMYYSCVQHFSVSCVKPKALAWISNVVEQPVIKITDDLEIVKTDNSEPNEQRGVVQDVFDVFEDFIQTHKVVAKVPHVLRIDGPLKDFLPRSFRPEVLSVPMATTGRSKAVKKIIVPFLLGLKFKTAVLVPLALALIALKTWKALTLGLLSLVLTGALVIFKLSKPKVATYEIVHYPHHHVEHHVEHHPPPAAGWEHQSYGREFTAQELAYNGYVNQE